MSGARTKRIKRVTRAVGDIADQLARLTTECHQGATFHIRRHDFESCWYATPFMHHRDSGALEDSNFEVISKDIPTADVRSFGHWGHGWYERLYVRRDDPAAILAVQRWINALSDYPVANEDHYSELEWERDHPGHRVGECYCDDDDCSVRAERCKGRSGYSCYGEAGDDGYCTDGSCEDD